MVRSYKFRVLAVDKVLSNSGSRSPGLSENIPYSYEDQIKLVEKLGEIVNNTSK